ncbi:TagK domain-containing protein [Achromobacter sp.]|uniref:TagK domain-containing protein n=1 Tax=Achromobacter sp. TaxID=134375 RepID=UPI003C7493DB
MTAVATDRSEPIAWGISLAAHAGYPQPSMHIHALQAQPLCLQTQSARLRPYEESENTSTDHAVFGVDDGRRAWIKNCCLTLSCRVNGAEMRPGERWMLADRDQVTVGLTQLLVVQSDSTQQWDAWAGKLPGSDAPDEAAALEALRALDDPLTEGGMLAPEERPHNRGLAIPDAAPRAQQDPFQALAAEFDQAILGTHQGARAIHTATASGPQSALPPPPDPFDAASPGSGTRMLLEGLLSEVTDINAILLGMNEFEASEFFAEAPHEDVLRLLAGKAGEPAGARALAALSRREHHDLSIDSYFEQDLSEPTQ